MCILLKIYSFKREVFKSACDNLKYSYRFRIIFIVQFLLGRIHIDIKSTHSEIYSERD